MRYKNDYDSYEIEDKFLSRQFVLSVPSNKSKSSDQTSFQIFCLKSLDKRIAESMVDGRVSQFFTISKEECDDEFTQMMNLVKRQSQV